VKQEIAALKERDPGVREDAARALIKTKDSRAVKSPELFVVESSGLFAAHAST
jgi:hypothetical protein